MAMLFLELGALQKTYIQSSEAPECIFILCTSNNNQNHIMTTMVAAGIHKKTPALITMLRH
jgi:hypothetical protein